MTIEHIKKHNIFILVARKVPRPRAIEHTTPVYQRGVGIPGDFYGCPMVSYRFLWIPMVQRLGNSDGPPHAARILLGAC